MDGVFAGVEGAKSGSPQCSTTGGRCRVIQAFDCCWQWCREPPLAVPDVCPALAELINPSVRPLDALDSGLEQRVSSWLVVADLVANLEPWFWSGLSRYRSTVGRLRLGIVGFDAFVFRLV